MLQVRQKASVSMLTSYTVTVAMCLVASLAGRGIPVIS